MPKSYKSNYEITDGKLIITKYLYSFSLEMTSTKSHSSWKMSNLSFKNVGHLGCKIVFLIKLLVAGKCSILPHQANGIELHLNKAIFTENPAFKKHCILLTISDILGTIYTIQIIINRLR